MKKFYSITLLLLLVFSSVLWIACGSNKNASTLSEIQKEHYREMARHTITSLHETNGSFETFLDYEISKIQENKQDFIVVAQRVKYSKNTLIYTISFDKDERLAGIFYR